MRFGCLVCLGLVCVVDVVEATWLAGENVRPVSRHFGPGTNSSWVAEQVARGEMFVSRANEYREAVTAAQSTSMLSVLMAPFVGRGGKVDSRALAYLSLIHI